MMSKYAPVSYLYASKPLIDGTVYIVKPLSVHIEGLFNKNGARGR